MKTILIVINQIANNNTIFIKAKETEFCCNSKALFELKSNKALLRLNTNSDKSIQFFPYIADKFLRGGIIPPLVLL